MEKIKTDILRYANGGGKAIYGMLWGDEICWKKWKVKHSGMGKIISKYNKTRSDGVKNNAEWGRIDYRSERESKKSTFRCLMEGMHDDWIAEKYMNRFRGRGESCSLIVLMISSKRKKIYFQMATAIFREK